METNHEFISGINPSSVKKQPIPIIEDDDKKSFVDKFPRKKRIRMLRKIIHWKQIDDAIKKCNIKKGANLYALEYLKLHLNDYVRIKDVQEYCNFRNKQDTGHPLGDPPRAFEILRKDKLPLEWSEIQYKKINTSNIRHT